jgi:hypothetical protein
MNKAIVATEIDESLEAGIGKALQALKPSGVAFHHLANADDEMSGKTTHVKSVQAASLGSVTAPSVV